MKNFIHKLETAKQDGQLAKLADEVLTEQSDYSMLPVQMEMLIEAGLSENDTYEGEPWFWWLMYCHETKYHLSAAKIIFEWLDIFKIKCDGENFFEFLQSKIDYSDYDSPYLVKLFLLSCAYVDSVSGLKMVENLYPEMFERDINYAGSVDLRENSKPFKLDASIFKDVDRFDFCVEMEEQKPGYYGCWHMFIYDKKSKLVVARYH